MLGNLSFYIVVNKNVRCAYIGEGTTLRLECSADQNDDDVHSKGRARPREVPTLGCFYSHPA